MKAYFLQFRDGCFGNACVVCYTEGVAIVAVFAFYTLNERLEFGRYGFWRESKSLMIRIGSRKEKLGSVEY
jgi:hypothetical protein